jgi:hypothetical protein
MDIGAARPLTHQTKPILIWNNIDNYPTPPYLYGREVGQTVIEMVVRLDRR